VQPAQRYVPWFGVVELWPRHADRAVVDPIIDRLLDRLDDGDDRVAIAFDARGTGGVFILVQPDRNPIAKQPSMMP
jgi:hypothetical protein